MRTYRLTIIIGAVIAAAVACGGSSGSSPTTSAALTAPQYKAALAQIAHQESVAQRSVGAAFHAKTISALHRAIAGFAADQARVARELTALRPPANAVVPNSELAKAFSDNATATRAVLSRIDHAPSVTRALALIQAAKGPQQTGQEIDQALSKLRRLGYATGR